MNGDDAGSRIAAWAQAEKEIVMLALIGSRARDRSDPLAADEYSDWDFQIATDSDQLFNDSGWLTNLGLKPLHYVDRTGRLGSARKITAIFATTEIDCVILPSASLRAAANQVLQGWPSVPPALFHATVDLAAVLRGGFRLLKGGEEFREFYEFSANRVNEVRLSDTGAIALADGFVCDYVSTRKKIARGELIAARRWLHVQLLEANLRLLHELRQRRGLPSQPDGRRLEQFDDPRQAGLRGEIGLDAPRLLAATERAAETVRELMGDLVGAGWRWPDLSSLRLGAE